jgi:hypothetical protein
MNIEDYQEEEECDENHNESLEELVTNNHSISINNHKMPINEGENEVSFMHSQRIELPQGLNLMQTKSSNQMLISNQEEEEEDEDEEKSEFYYNESTQFNKNTMSQNSPNSPYKNSPNKKSSPPPHEGTFGKDLANNFCTFSNPNLISPKRMNI